MSKMIEEQTLEQAVTRKVTTGERSTARNNGAARTAKPKKTSKPTMTKVAGQSRLVKTRAVGKKNAAERAIIADEIMPTTEAKPESQNLMSEVEAPAASSQASSDLGSTMSAEMQCHSEETIGKSTLEEKEVDAGENEPEVTNDLAETRQATGRGTLLRWLVGAWNWSRQNLTSRQARKRLRVCETVSLGEKRFVAVIEVDGEQFLVGGASTSVATLARLEPSQEFSAVLRRRWAQDPVQA
jgi:hypothetical protein